MKKRVATVVAGMVMAGTAGGGLIIDPIGYRYEQDFDTLKEAPNSQQGVGEWVDNSTIAGWWWDSPRAERDPDVYGYVADSGSSTTGTGHSYGADGSTERAMGVLTAGSGTDVHIGVQFRNMTGSAISLEDILVGYVGEQWRRNTGTHALEFSYAIASSEIVDTLAASGTWIARNALDFAPLHTGTSGELDGNDSVNQTVFSNISVDTSGTLADGDYLMLRWTKTGTNSTGLAVDDFSLEVIPEPGTLGLLLGAGALLAPRRRRG